MKEIYNLISDGVLANELASGLRNRKLEQKFLYLNKWWDHYYNFKEADKVYEESNFTAEDLIEIWIKWNVIEDENTAIVSLWCGKCVMEKDIFSQIWDSYNIDFFWVDTSRNILETALEEMKELENIKSYFIRSDFSSNDFKTELNQLTQEYKKRMFVFFSNTFGNIGHTNIIDILYNLLNKWESLWLDVRLRAGTSAKDDLKLADLSSNYLKNEKYLKFYLYPLEKIGIPTENGKIVRKTRKEPSINALRFQNSFLFTKKTEIEIKKEKIVILPWEKINMLQFYVYDADGLINFFKEHNFKLIKKQIKNLRWQFLFQKI